RRPGDDAGRGPAVPWPPSAIRLGRHRLARTDATARDRPRTADAPPACRRPRLLAAMAGGCRPHRGRVRIPRHGEDRARLGIRRGRPRFVWMEVGPGADLESFADSLARSTGERASDPDQAESVAAALTHVFAGERKLLVLDGYADV